MGTPCTPYNRGLTRKENNKIYVREEVGVECPADLPPHVLRPNLANHFFR